MPNETSTWDSVTTKEDHLGVCRRVGGVVSFLIRHDGDENTGDAGAMVDVSEWDAAQIASFILGDKMLRKVEAKGRTYNVVLTREADEGGYSVRCIELSGAISQGETLPETMENIAEAIMLLLEAEEAAEDQPGTPD